MELRNLLDKYNLHPNKYYPTTKLWEILVDLGITNHNRLSFTTGWISRKVNRGELVLPPKGKYNRHAFTGNQIIAIIEAFTPGGSGHWDYRADSPYSDEADLAKAES